jgi:hypothetical protein
MRVKLSQVDFFQLRVWEEVVEGVILSLGLLASGLLRLLSQKLSRKNRHLESHLRKLLITIWFFLKIKGRSRCSQVRQGRGPSSSN